MPELSKPRAFTFPPKLRLKKRSDFTRVQEQGHKLFSKHFLLFILTRENESFCRIGITVSKKVHANSVRRNQVKRYIREFFRQNHSSFLKPLDIVVIAKREADKCSLTEVSEQLTKALRYHRLLPNEII